MKDYPSDEFETNIYRLIRSKFAKDEEKTKDCKFSPVVDQFNSVCCTTVTEPYL